MKESKKDKLREYLMKGYSVSGIEALGLFGLMSLPQRILELRSEGLPIKTKSEEGISEFGKNVHGRYYIERDWLIERENNKKKDDCSLPLFGGDEL